MKKALLFLSFLWMCLFTIDTHAIAFYIAENDTWYPIDQYGAFLSTIRGMFTAGPVSLQEIHIKVYANSGEQADLTVSMTDLYITQINGVNLTPRELNYNSSTDNINMSIDNINSAIIQASAFPNMRQNAAWFTKILACIISEAVRFQRVAGLTTSALQQYMPFNREEITGEVTDWARTCRLMRNLRCPNMSRGGFYVGIPWTYSGRTIFIDDFVSSYNWWYSTLEPESMMAQ